MAKVIDLLLEEEIVKSKSQARRLIAQGGVFVDDEKMWHPLQDISIGEHTIRIGKKKTFEVEVEEPEYVEPDFDFNDDGSKCWLLGGK
jgi:tyrosyl-tRNA synthetase